MTPTHWWRILLLALLVPVTLMLVLGVRGLAFGATQPTSGRPAPTHTYTPSPIETPTHIHHACHWKNCAQEMPKMRRQIHITRTTHSTHPILSRRP